MKEHLWKNFKYQSKETGIVRKKNQIIVVI